MQDSTDNKALGLDDVAEEFLGRLREGSHPSVREYQDRFPDLADEIAELFPTLASLERIDLGQSPANDTPSFDAPNRLGDYRILREIGRGGMGIVYEAEHVTMRRRVALKVLATSKNHKANTKRFLREARAAGQLHHTNIVPVFEVGESDGIHFYAMQYIHGQNLDVVLDELRRLEVKTSNDGQPQPPQPKMQPDVSESTAALWAGEHMQATTQISKGNEKAGNGSQSRPSLGSERNDVRADVRSDSLAIGESSTWSDSTWSEIGNRSRSYYRRVARGALQVADALDFAHKHGVLHRDIKPSNLLLDTDGVIWVSDFGLAKDDSEDLTHTGDIIGTLRYMAPERFTRAADARSDVYSLGLTLYELCTMRYAYDKTDRAQLMQQITTRDPVPPCKLRPEIPLDLETIITKSIAREPELRYQHAHQMSRDLELFLADKPVLARRVSIVEKFWRWCRRNPSYAMLFACISLLGTLIVLGAMGFAIKTQQHAVQLQSETTRAQRAELESSRSLYESYVGHANANRWSGRRGQRFETLEQIRRAASLLPILGFNDELLELKRFELRNIAVAAMPLTDVREIRQWDTGSRAPSGISPNGELLAWSEEDGLLQVRSVETGKLIARLQGPKEQAWIPEFHASSKYIAAEFHDAVPLTPRKVLVWEVATQRKVLDLREGLRLAMFAFHPFEEQIAVCKSSGQVDVYSLMDGSLEYSLQAGRDAHRLKFDPQGNLVAISQSGAVYLLAPDAPPQSVSTPETVHTLSWTDAGDILLGGRDGGVWKMAGWDDEQAQQLTQHNNNVFLVAHTDHNRLVVSAGWGDTRRLHDLRTSRQLLSLDGFEVFDVARQRNRIAISEPFRYHSVCELAVGEPLSITSVRQGQVWQALPHPLHDDLILIGFDTGIEIWDVAQRERLAECPEQKLTDMVLSQDGERLLCAYAGNRPPTSRTMRISRTAEEVWKVQLGNPQSIPGLDVLRDSGLSNHLAASNNLDHIASIDRAAYARIVETGESGTAVTRRIGPHANLSRLAMNPDGSQIITSTWHGEGFRVWDVRNGDLIKDLAPRHGSGWAKYSPDGSLLLTNSEEATVIWDTETWFGTEVERGDSQGNANRVVFSPDSRLALVWDNPFVPMLVDARTGRRLVVLETPARVATLPAFTSDGKRIVLVASGQMMVWNIEQLQGELAELGLGW